MNEARMQVEISLRSLSLDRNASELAGRQGLKRKRMDLALHERPERRVNHAMTLGTRTPGKPFRYHDYIEMPATRPRTNMPGMAR